MDLGRYNSKQNNQQKIDEMSNYCPSIPMPEARKESALRPYDLPVRQESIVDLGFKRTRDQKIVGLVGLARSYNALGKTFILKKELMFAKSALIQAGVQFAIGSLALGDLEVNIV